jgi:hypothetical protein
MTPYTINEDLDLCKRHHSKRLLTYLSVVANDSHDGYLFGLLNDYDENGDPVWTGSHPLPA